MISDLEQHVLLMSLLYNISIKSFSEKELERVKIIASYLEPTNPDEIIVKTMCDKLQELVPFRHLNVKSLDESTQKYFWFIYFNAVESNSKFQALIDEEIHDTLKKFDMLSEFERFVKIACGGEA